MDTAPQRELYRKEYLTVTLGVPMFFMSMQQEMSRTSSRGMDCLIECRRHDPSRNSVVPPRDLAAESKLQRYSTTYFEPQLAPNCVYVGPIDPIHTIWIWIWISLPTLNFYLCLLADVGAAIALHLPCPYPQSLFQST